jgi:hypothetical protein
MGLDDTGSVSQVIENNDDVRLAVNGLFHGIGQAHIELGAQTRMAGRTGGLLLCREDLDSWWRAAGGFRRSGRQEHRGEQRHQNGATPHGFSRRIGPKGRQSHAHL